MVEFGHQRYDWLSEVLELPNGIPSHDTFNRVLQLIDPKHLSDCLDKDGAALLGSLSGKQLAIDGKKLKGVSPRSKGNSGLYILNAWVCENRLCVGQEKVEDKSNEITAIPTLLEQLDIEGAVVSIDAIGCQSAIANQILEQGGEYLLAVKKNQKELFEQLEDSFLLNPSIAQDMQWEYQRGRFEQRKCQILQAHQMLRPETLAQWKGVKTLVKIDAQRHEKDKISQETRYYISSEEGQADRYFNHLTRGHWGIENQLHWHLDVTFKEDASRARSGYAPQNLSILRKIALHRIAQMKDKLSLKKRRYRASLNNEYLLQLIQV
jgi:predicted transposase YbfD/YdcC